MQAKTVSWNDIRPQVFDNPEVQAEYEALEEELKLMHQVISFRKAKWVNYVSEAQAFPKKDSTA